VSEGVGEGLAKSLLRVESDVFSILAHAADLDTVVGSVSHRVVGCLCGGVELLLKVLGLLEAVELDWAWELLLFVEFFAEAFGQHLVDADVGEEAVIVLEERASILVLLEVSLELVVANHFGNGWDFQVLDFVLEVSLWVLDKDTDARSVVSGHERVCKLDLRRSWCRLLGYLGKRESELDEFIFLVEEALLLSLLGLGKLL